MKISAAVLISSAVDASHFRAISYEAIQSGSGKVRVSRTHTWRQSKSGYSGGCDAKDIQKQKAATRGTEYCTLQSGGSCGTIPASYIVTDIEDQLSSSNNFCYGYDGEAMAKPSGPYTMTWGGCCWVPFTTDGGAILKGGAYASV